MQAMWSSAIVGYAMRCSMSRAQATLAGLYLVPVCLHTGSTFTGVMCLIHDIDMPQTSSSAFRKAGRKVVNEVEARRRVDAWWRRGC